MSRLLTTFLALIAIESVTLAQPFHSSLDFRSVAQPGTTIASHTFATETLIDGVALNDAGEIAFVARWTDHAAVFTSRRMVAEQGDVIDGRFINSIGSRLAINTAGQVAFEASYSDTAGAANSTGIFVDKHLALTITPGAPFTLTDDGRVIAKDESPAPKGPSTLDRLRSRLPRVPAVPLPKAPAEPRRDLGPSVGPFPMNRAGQVLVPVNLRPGFLLLLGTPVPH